MDWKGILKGVAPMLGGALGGPLGAAAASTIAKKFLGQDAATDKELEDFILNASPEQLAELKKLDYDFKTKMAELGFKEKELIFDDRSNARSMAVAKGMTPQIILSAIYTIGYFAVLWQFVTGDVVIPTETTSEFNMVLGVMTAAQVQIMNFWFGSSSGSKQKTEKMVAN